MVYINFSSTTGKSLGLTVLTSMKVQWHALISYGICWYIFHRVSTRNSVSFFHHHWMKLLYILPPLSWFWIVVIQYLIYLLSIYIALSSSSFVISCNFYKHWVLCFWFCSSVSFVCVWTEYFHGVKYFLL